MLKSGRRYRLTTPTIALTPDDAVGHDVAIRIPEGGIVEVTQVPTDGSPSLHVRWERKECEMFAQDLHEPGEAVKTAGDRLPF